MLSHWSRKNNVLGKNGEVCIPVYRNTPQSASNITACILQKDSLLKNCLKEFQATSSMSSSLSFLRKPHTGATVNYSKQLSARELQRLSPATSQGSRKLLTVFSPNHLQNLEPLKTSFIFPIPLWLIMFLFNSVFGPVPFSTNLLCRQACEFSQLYQCSRSITKLCIRVKADTHVFRSNSRIYISRIWITVL